ncbi:MAG: YaiI/YqxD family protein [Gammaproteobacteria bacterium]|nr:MAG: YaiI/YqxD family protein [Gammaproteobacteria bacterium]
MQIWVDADACPKAIKEILFRAAERVQLDVVLVANQPLRTPPSRFIKARQVPAGFDVADKVIAENVSVGDLVITADIPLAADVVERGGVALNPRGEFYTTENIQERLTMRNLMDELRGSGVMTGGPAPLKQADRQEFANQLDRFLARELGNRPKTGQ